MMAVPVKKIEMTTSCKPGKTNADGKGVKGVALRYGRFLSLRAHITCAPRTSRTEQAVATANATIIQ